MPENPKKILIVDDDPAILHILHFNFSKHGYDIYKASDGAEALEIISVLSPDLIITDIMMPRIDGYALMNRLKENPEWSDIPVVMLTAKGDDKERVDGLSSGADDYIAKPFNVDELILKVEKLLYFKERIIGAEVRFVEAKKLLDLSKEELADAYAQLEKLMVESLESLITAIEARDSYTKGHSERVAEYSGNIARVMKMNAEDVKAIEIAARLHDIGKIAVRDVILYKKTKLTDEEMDIIKSHTVKGAEIIEKISFLRGIIPAVKYHHERRDGLGFPEGLKGEDIPLAAQIIAVADTFDAIVTSRPYRNKMPLSYALSELEKYSGSQFDPDVVNAFFQSGSFQT